MTSSWWEWVSELSEVWLTQDNVGIVKNCYYEEGAEPESKALNLQLGLIVTTRVRRLCRAVGLRDRVVVVSDQDLSWQPPFGGSPRMIKCFDPEHVRGLNICVEGRLNYLAEPAATTTRAPGVQLGVHMNTESNTRSGSRQHFWDLPCPAGQSRGGHWDCTVCASASESYPGKQHESRDRWDRGKTTAERLKALDGIRSHPLFHDVVCVVGHFLHYTEGSCVEREQR